MASAPSVPTAGAAASDAGPVHVGASADEPRIDHGDAGAGPPPGSRIRCFGQFEIEVAGRPVDLSAVKPKARAALRLLALHAGRPVHRELLAEALWPDANGRHASIRNLQVAISSLRQALDPASTPSGATSTEASRSGGTVNGATSAAGTANGDVGTIARDGDGYGWPARAGRLRPGRVRSGAGPVPVRGRAGRAGGGVGDGTRRLPRGAALRGRAGRLGRGRTGTAPNRGGRLCRRLSPDAP